MPERNIGGTVLGMSMALENAELRAQNAELQRENVDLRGAVIGLQERIRDLEDKITRAVVVDHEDIDATKAYLGATVRVRNTRNGNETVYQLVSPVETDLAAGKISVQSPVGRALVGHVVGDVVQAKVPAGELEFEILDITR